MDQTKKTQKGETGWGRHPPPNVNLGQCRTPTGRSLTNPYSQNVSSPRVVGGLQVKPAIRGGRGRTSLVELTYAERPLHEVPMSPLASTGSPKETLASPREVVQKSPFRKRSQIRLSSCAARAITSKGGNKKAVLISASYINTEGARKLESCASLSLLYDLFVVHLGFSKENVWVLTDEPRTVPGAVTFSPTRGNIVNAMRWLVRNSGKGDQLMFSFSGRGCRVARQEKSKDALEDCILPTDFPTSSPIIENEIKDILVQTLGGGATLTTLFDCRNSAGVMKLPYVHVIAEGAKGSFALREELEISKAEPISTRGVVLNSVLRFSKIKRENAEYRKKIAEERRNAFAASCFDNGTVICIAASGEPEADSMTFASTTSKHGALTSAFVSYMRHSATQKNKASYSSVLCAMSTWLSSNGENRLPQFSSTHNVNPEMIVTLL